MTKNFPEVILGIRTAKKGVEVREDIAQMGEYVEQFAATATQKADAAAASEKKASDAVANIDQQKADSVAAVQQAQTTATVAITQTKDTALNDIGDAKTAALRDVENSTTTATAAASAAAGSASDANASKEAAATSAAAAADSASAASTSETNSSASESAAQKSAEEAAASAALAGTRAGTDKTLSIENAPADAKTVGDKFKSIKTDWNSVTDKPSTFPSTWDSVSGKPSSYPPSAHTHSYITNSGDATAITGAIGTPGLSLQQAHNNGYPTTYGNVLSIGGQGDGQILAGWSDSNNGIERLYYRNRRDICDTWSAWKAIAFTDDSNALSAYPVGSIYMSTSSTSPASLFGGTWESIASERVLMGVSGSHGAGSTVDAGLPNISSGSNAALDIQGSWGDPACRAPFAQTWRGNSELSSSTLSSTPKVISARFDASLCNSIYGRSSTVQPAAYYVYMWRRVA